MESIMKADIFFFITSISIVVITVIIIIAGYYIIRTLQNVREISETLKDGVHEAQSDIHEISDHVTTSPLFRFIFGAPRKHKNK